MSDNHTIPHEKNWGSLDFFDLFRYVANERLSSAPGRGAGVGRNTDHLGYIPVRSFP